MSVGKRVEEAIAKMDAADPEGALFQISSAIDATAKKECGKGGRASYKGFIHGNLGLITEFAFRGQSILNLHLGYKHPEIDTDEKGCCTIEDVFYHAVRCSLYHEAGLPSDLRFTDEGQIRVEGGSVVLPSALIYGLIAAVVLSPANANERVSGTSVLKLGDSPQELPLLLNCLWGKRNEFFWLRDALRQTANALKELPRNA